MFSFGEILISPAFDTKLDLRTILTGKTQAFLTECSQARFTQVAAAEKVRLAFCSVDESCMVSGGERYDSWLRDSLAGEREYDVSSLVLYPSVLGEKISGKLPLYKKVYAPFRAAAKVIRHRCALGAGSRIWHFNTSKCLYFLPALLVLKLLGDKCVGITHHMMYLQFSGLKRFLYKVAELLFVSFLDMPVAPSPYTRDLLRSHLPGKDIRLLSIPFEHSDGFHGEVDKEKDSMVYVGTVEPRKGLHHLLDSMSIMKEQGKDMQLSIVGKETDTAYASELRARVRRENLNVKFEGYVNEERKKNLLRKAEIFVFPSEAEGYGIVLLEAMQAGLPIVAFKNTSIPYVLGDNERGLVCPDGDSASMADAITRLSDDPGLRRNLVEKGYEYADSMPRWDEFEAHWKSLLHSVSEAHVRPRRYGVFTPPLRGAISRAGASKTPC